MIGSLKDNHDKNTSPAVPKVLSLGTKVMDETNLIKPSQSDIQEVKIKHGKNESLTQGQNIACPLMCKCKWKRGKETVECASKGFKSIPHIKDSGTQV